MLRPWTLLLAAAVLTGCAQTAEVRPVYKAGAAGAFNDALAAHEAGRREFAGGRFAEAAADFSREARLAPDDLGAKNGMAAAYDRLGRFDLADGLYEQCLMAAPNDVPTLNNLGYSLLLRGQRNEAAVLLAHAAALAPEDAVVAGNLALAKATPVEAAPPPEPPPPSPLSHLIRLGTRLYQWISSVKGVTA